MDFTESLFFDARRLLSRKDVPEIDPWGFLYPLTGTVWAAVTAALAVVWLAAMLVGWRPGNFVRFRELDAGGLPTERAHLL